MIIHGTNHPLPFNELGVVRDPENTEKFFYVSHSGVKQSNSGSTLNIYVYSVSLR